MRCKCLNCGKTFSTETTRSYCPTCREQMEKLVIKQTIACFREEKQLEQRISEVSDGRIRYGRTGGDPSVLVFDGIEELAELLGEEIQVAECDDDSFCWFFWFTHDGFSFHDYGKKGNARDESIVKGWEEKHGTFH